MPKNGKFVADLNVLETECENFQQCSKKYENEAYMTFNNSYLSNCSASYVVRAKNKIKKYYNNVKEDYQNIYNWWQSYNDNVSGLESYLSGNGTGKLSEQRIINYLRNSLEKLEEYSFDAEILYSSISKNLSNFNADVSDISDLEKTKFDTNLNYNNNNTNSVNDIKKDKNSQYSGTFKKNADSYSLNSNQDYNQNIDLNNDSNFNFVNFNSGKNKVDVGFSENDISNPEEINGQDYDDQITFTGKVVSFDEIFGQTQNGTNLSFSRENLMNLTVDNSKLGDFTTSINVHDNNSLNQGEKLEIQKSGLALGGGLTLGLKIAFSNGDNKANKENSSSGSNFTQGRYNSDYSATGEKGQINIQTNNNGNNKTGSDESANYGSNGTLGKNSMRQASYLDTMGIQNVDMTNNAFSFDELKGLQQKIIGLIKAILTNSIIVCNTKTITYKTSELANNLHEVKAQMLEVRYLNILGRINNLKSKAVINENNSVKYISVLTNSINLNDTQAVVAKPIEPESGFDVWINDKFIKVTGFFTDAKEALFEILPHHPAADFFSNGFDSLNINLSKNKDKEFVEKNKHVDYGESFVWANASKDINVAYYKDLENCNLTIDAFYSLYDNLSVLASDMDKVDFNSLSLEEQKRMQTSMENIITNLSSSSNPTDLETNIINNLMYLLPKIQNNTVTTEDEKLIKGMIGDLCNEKSVAKGIIYQLENTRKTLPYSYMSKMEDFEQFSDFSNLYDNCKYDASGNVIESAVITYNSDTHIFTINGKEYLDEYDYEQTGKNFSSLDQLTLYYLIANGKLAFPEDEFTTISSFSMYEARGAEYLTEDEVKTYHYLYEKYGYAEADKYFESMQDILNQRKGFQSAIDYINSLEGDNHVEKFAKLHANGIGMGINQYVEGIDNVIFANGILSADTYKQMWILQILNGQVDLETLENSDRATVAYLLNEYETTGAAMSFSYQGGITVGNMVIPIAVSSLISPYFSVGGAASAGSTAATTVASSSIPEIVSCSLITASTYGNTKNQALHDGASVKDANIQGLLSGLSEGGLEFLLGNIPGLSKTSSNTLFGYLKEGGQECIQQFADMCIRMSNGEYISFEQFTEEEFNTFVMSVMVSAEMNGASTTVSFAGNTIMLSADNINQIRSEQGVAGVSDYIKGKLSGKNTKNISNNKVTENKTSTKVSEEANSLKTNLDEVNSDNINVVAVNSEGKVVTQESSKIDNFNQNVASMKKTLGTKLKNLASDVFSFAETLSFPLIMSNPLAAPFAVALVFDGGYKLLTKNKYDVGNNHSLFRATKNNHSIEMTPLSFKQLENVAREMKEISDSYSRKSIGLAANLQIQLANFLLDLPATNKKGEKISYTAKTHESVVKMLVELQEKGFIEPVNTKGVAADLKEVEIDGKVYKVKYTDKGIANLIKKGKSYLTTDLLVERVLLGGPKVILDLFKNDKSNRKLEYEVNFQLTDKKFTEADALEMIKRYNKENNIGILTDKDGTRYLGLTKENNNKITENQTPIEVLEDINENTQINNPIEIRTQNQKTTNLTNILNNISSKLNLDFLNLNINAISKVISSTVGPLIAMNPAGLAIRYIEKKVTQNTKMTETIKNEGVYHFTNVESAQKIMESGYIKPTTEPLFFRWMYDHNKAYMFAGLPSFDTLLSNKLGKLSSVIAAVHIKPTDEQINNLNYRVLDGAVTNKGKLTFDESQAEIIYFGLTYENGQYMYKQIDKSEISDYNDKLNRYLKENNIKQFNIFKNFYDAFKTEFDNQLNVILELSNDFKTARFNKHDSQENVELLEEDINLVEKNSDIKELSVENNDINSNSNDLQSKINRLHELEKIDDIDIEFFFDENNHNSLHHEYERLKSYIDIQLTDERTYLQNKLKTLLELQRNSSNPDYLSQSISKLKEIINNIEAKKQKILNLTGKSIYELANIKITEATISQELFDCAEKNAIEILNNAKSVENQVTKDMKNLESENAFLIGEDFKFKNQDRLAKKIISDASKMTKKDISDLTIDDINIAAKLIGDGLRYTLIIDKNNYKREFENSLNNLTKKGYQVLNVKDYWNQPHYKGINVSIETLTGFRFELQFHTPDSYKTKEFLTHDFYQVKRNDDLSLDIQNLADDIQKSYQSLVEVPDGIIDYVWNCEEKINEINNLFVEENIDFISKLSLEKKVYLLSKIDIDNVYSYFNQIISTEEIIRNNDFNIVSKLLNLFDANMVSDILNNQAIKDYLLSQPNFFKYLNSCFNSNSYFNPKVEAILNKMSPTEVVTNFDNLMSLLKSVKRNSRLIEIVLNKMSSEEIINKLDSLIPLLEEESSAINEKITFEDLPDLMKKNHDAIVSNPKYRQVFENLSISQKLIFLYYYQDGKITNDGLDILLELYNKNKYIVEDLNPTILCNDVIEIGKKFVTKIAVHTIGYINDFIDLYHNDILFNKFKFIFSNMLNDNTLETYDAKIKILLEYFSDNKNAQFLTNLDIESMDYSQIKILTNYILHECSDVFHPNLKQDPKFNINVKFEDPIQYQQDFYKRCDEMFYLENISDRERCNILLNKYFGLSLNEAEYILSMYSTNYDNVAKYETDSNTCSEFLDMLGDIIRMNHSELIECYSDMRENYTNFEEIVSIEQEIKQVYARSINNALYKTKTEIDSRISNGRYSSIEYNGNNVKVIDLNGSYDLLIHCYGNNFGEFYNEWNSNSSYYNHGICCSFTNSSKLKQINGGGIITIGFFGFDNKALRFDSCYDIYSANCDIVTTFEDRGIQVKFAGAEDLIKNTEEYNEVVIEREELRDDLKDKNSYIQPDFVIVYNGMEQYEINKAYDAASQMGIPVLRINK